ncbi:hypothetical protein [Devosia ginsengisoli]|uniref:hypothetical protein n=1 Tax=Devosia ginsengisoli TaxID=400770 RepID=UPI0026EE1BEC|nr:hypothetical protein [Devosia ginsengisoli]MCR6672053.1 hypothetical protein [Devosia ginsengisoli]
MSQPTVLMLTYPPAWAEQLRRQFAPKHVDIVVKARRPAATFLPEHDLYRPGEDVAPDLPDLAHREIELSLQRCYTGKTESVRAIARQVLANADQMLARSAYRRIIFRTVPHMPHEFALYHCARARGIETLFSMRPVTSSEHLFSATSIAGNQAPQRLFPVCQHSRSPLNNARLPR